MRIVTVRALVQAFKNPTTIDTNLYTIFTDGTLSKLNL